MIVIAHLSDTHIDGGARSRDRTARLLNYLDDLPHQLDAILVTGDVADHGSVSEYEQASELLGRSRHVLVCPGNHDARAEFRQVLLDARAGHAAPVNQIHHMPGADFALCDSTIPGHDDGVLADETIDWLDSVLADTPGDIPAFLCFHHPPVPLGIPYVDAIRQHGEERLAEVISRYPRIVAILCGHAHSAAATTFAGLPVRVAPGVASTVMTPWEPGQTINYQLPPGVAFHILHDDRRLTTHYRFIPDQHDHDERATWGQAWPETGV